ncbi:MAG: hypothetical protein LLG37_04155 [Spirochaetia bacterium]|nr:hypothetical protein [Spirochaetia bacterium]
MKKIFLTAALLLAVSALFGANPGTPGAFIDIGTAKAGGMGNAFVAIADDASAIFYNPAGLTQQEYREFSFMYCKYKNIVPFNYAAFSFPLFNNDRAVGVGLIVSGDTLINEITMSLAYSENLDWLLKIIGLKGLKLGATAKVQYAGYGNNTDGGEASDGKISGSAKGYAMDFGILYQINPDVQVGAILRDALSWILWTNDSTYWEGTGMTNDIGMRYKIKDFQTSLAVSDFDKLKIGIEKTFFEYFDVRGGLTQTLDIESYREYMIGLGIGRFVFGTRKEFSMNIDAAYMFERLDNTLKISTSFKFK